MNKTDFMRRSKNLAVNVARLCLKLSFNPVNRCYANQIIRSAASSGANYRAACRAKSKADFINKLRMVEEELDETLYFLELIAAFNELLRVELRILYQETEELLSIIIASINTTINNEAKRK